MENPLGILKSWLEEERKSGNVFPQGAVLSTVAQDGAPSSRMVGTLLDENDMPKFHTSPASRKVDQIRFNDRAAMTYSFQSSLRSISLEGYLKPLGDTELERDWLRYDRHFRRHYVVFGGKSGSKLASAADLVSESEALKVSAEERRPESFIGYRFEIINRISFYSVKRGSFAECTLYEFDSKKRAWKRSELVP